MILESKDQKTSDQKKAEEKEDQLINLTIHNIFVKDLSYESPDTPQVFSLAWEPEVKFDIQVMRRIIDQVASLYEVVLHATISSKINSKINANNNNGISNIKDQKYKEIIAFVIDIKLAGMFTVTGLPDAHLDKVLSTTAPTILFPYLAENISSLVTRGGFPQFILPPIDFFTLYQQKVENQQPL